MKICLTRNFIKASTKYKDKTNLHYAYIVKRMKIKDETKKLRQQRQFTTVKDHKHDFSTSLEYRLFNTIKSILETILLNDS